MKKIIRNFFYFLLFPLLFGCNGSTNTVGDTAAADANESILSLLTDSRTMQYFSDEPVPLEDITAILNAGGSATSGMNMQPWYFGAILNQEVIQEIAGTIAMGGPPPGAPGNAPAGAPPQGAPGNPPAGAPAAGEGASMLPPSSSAYPKAGFADAPAAIAIATDPNNAFSTGLACQNMVIAAEALGYGTKIMAGGAAQMNTEENRALLHIPDGMNVIAILIVGKPDTTIDMTADGITGASTRKPLDEISTIVE